MNEAIATDEAIPSIRVVDGVFSAVFPLQFLVPLSQAVPSDLPPKPEFLAEEGNFSGVVVRK